MCKEGKCQEKSLLAVFDDFFEISTLKKSVFWNNSGTTFSNLMYDSLKFMLEHPLNDKKEWNEKLNPEAHNSSTNLYTFFDAPGISQGKLPKFVVFPMKIT